MSVLWGLAVVWTGVTTQFERAHLWGIFFLACGAASIELTRRQGEPAGVAAKDLLLPWLLPIAVVLPPMYALLAPIPLVVLTQWRIRRTKPHRRVFTASATGLALGTSSWTFHSLADGLTLASASGRAVVTWTVAAGAAALLTVTVSAVLVAAAVKLSSPEETWRRVLLNRESVTMDGGEASLSLVVAVLSTVSPLLTLIAMPPVILFQRAFMHDQLTTAARMDPKTALLNAMSWEREASSEIARVRRTGGSLCVLLIDIDHFKVVNDELGHLAGDEALRSVAGVLRAQLREYDLCARFGGDEFAVLLPQSDAGEAHRTAERIRRHVAAIRGPLEAGGTRITVSIGLAELTSPELDVPDLLAAADAALYRAKAEGRDQVWSGPNSISKPLA